MMAAKFWEQQTVAAPRNERLDAALVYVKMGWAVVPLHWIDQGACSCHNGAQCRTPGKHPNNKLVPNGLLGASKDAAKITDWYGKEPRLNIGIATGEISGFVALDVDPRNGGDDTLAELQKKFGAMPDTATAYTGGGGQHFLFKDAAQNFKSKAGTGLDIKKAGGYIIVWPSVHKSGEQYKWEGALDPMEGAAFADAPLWMIDAPRKTGNLSIVPNATGYLDSSRIADLRGALVHLNADDYPTWIAVGQALHSTAAGNVAFEIYDTWSQTSGKYENGETLKKWNTFKVNGPLHVESIFVWARDAGWDGQPEVIANPVAAEDIAPPPETNRYEDGPPSHLLQIPGALGLLVKEINRTAPKRQPQFAVATALAFGSVICSRRFVTTNNNFSSLYFLEIGQSGCGKEYGRKVIEKVLSDAKLTHLIGPSDYTSNSAVYYELLEKPAHIAIIDEFGAMIRHSRSASAFHKGMMLEYLKTLWGQLDGTVRPIARSKAQQTDKQKLTREKDIFNPALCLLGMGTPKQFYEALTPDSIEAGFLGRMIVVQTNIGRMPAGMPVEFETPQEILDWCAATRDGEGNLTAIPLGGDIAPSPKTVPIHGDAWAVYQAYDREVNARWESLEREGVAELEGRSAEKALRLALILAISDNPISPMISAEHMRWAVDYVRYYTAQMIAAVREHMVAGRFAKWCSLVTGALRRNSERGTLAAQKGLTWAEICDAKAELSDLRLAEQRAVIDVLKDRDLIGDAPASEGKRGRKRVAWVLVKQDDE